MLSASQMEQGLEFSHCYLYCMNIELLHVMSQIMWQSEVVYNWQCCAMVLCVVVGCSKWSPHDKDVPFYRIPKIIINRGEETKILSEKRRNGFVAVISKRDISYSKKFSSRQIMFLTPLVWNAGSNIVFFVYLVYLNTVLVRQRMILRVYTHVQYWWNAACFQWVCLLHKSIRLQR